MMGMCGGQENMCNRLFEVGKKYYGIDRTIYEPGIHTEYFRVLEVNQPDPLRPVHKIRILDLYHQTEISFRCDDIDPQWRIKESNE